MLSERKSEYIIKTSKLKVIEKPKLKKKRWKYKKTEESEFNLLCNYDEVDDYANRLVIIRLLTTNCNILCISLVPHDKHI